MGFLSSLFGSSKSKPATTTNVVSQKLPEEIAPFAKEVLGEAQQLYKANIERGYDPFTGQTIAPFTPEQQRSMEGISGLVGTSRPLQEEALATYRQGAEQFTGDTAQQYMSPYQQAVTDIEKREAQRNFEGNILPRLEAQAVGAGAMSGLGSRAGVEFAEAQRNQAQLLSDIQAKGQQAAFQDASRRFEQQKNRERAMAGDVSQLGPAMFASGLQEQGALGAVGEQKQQLAQSALDEAYFKFLEEEQYPQQQLANYSGFVYGNPAAGLIQQTDTGTKTPFQPSFGQSLLGIGSTLGAAALRNPNIFSGFGGGASVPGTGKKEGGKVSGGLAGLVRRQEGKQVGRGDSQFTKDFINPITGFFGGLGDKLEQQQERAREKTNLGKAIAAQRRSNLSDYFFKSADDPKVVSGIDALREKQLDQEDFEGRIRSQNAKPNYDEELLQGRELVDPEIEAQLKEKSGPQKEAIKVIQSLSTQPKALTNKQSAALDEKEAGKIYDNNPTAFGDLTRKQYLADTKAQNEKYLAFVNKMYPEGQNEFLADALQAFGAMVISENKGEAFINTFNKLQEAGVKRRDARRIAIGKVGLENLKRDDATLEKIRMLPKKRKEAIEKILAKKYGIEKRDLDKRKTEAQIEKDLALAGKAKRYKPKTTKIKELTKADIDGIQSYLSDNTLVDFKGRIENDPTFRKGIAERLSSSLDVGDLTDEIDEVFNNPSFIGDVKIELQKIKRDNENVSILEATNLAALRAIGKYKAAREALSTTDVVRRSQSK